jgi:hypothetical protein
MREIRTSGLTRGEAIRPSPTLPFSSALRLMRFDFLFGRLRFRIDKPLPTGFCER